MTTTTVLYSYQGPPSKGDGNRSGGELAGEFQGGPPVEQALLARYEEIAWAEELRWDTRYRKQRLLGAGGQGAVYLADRLGSDGFVRPVALKVFSPEPYRNDDSYRDDMARVSNIGARVALIQSDNVVDVHDFVEWQGIRMMEMEWLDGYDLREVLDQRMLDRT